jgi:hypothetical protein
MMLYQQALLRALSFWFRRSWINFLPDQEKARRKADSIQSHKSKATYSRRALQVPDDFGERMVHAALSCQCWLLISSRLLLAQNTDIPSS